MMSNGRKNTLLYSVGWEQRERVDWDEICAGNGNVLVLGYVKYRITLHALAGLGGSFCVANKRRWESGHLRQKRTHFHLLTHLYCYTHLPSPSHPTPPSALHHIASLLFVAPRSTTIVNAIPPLANALSQPSESQIISLYLHLASIPLISDRV